MYLILTDAILLFKHLKTFIIITKTIIASIVMFLRITLTVGYWGTDSRVIRVSIINVCVINNLCGIEHWTQLYIQHPHQASISCHKVARVNLQCLNVTLIILFFLIFFIKKIFWHYNCFHLEYFPHIAGLAAWLVFDLSSKLVVFCWYFKTISAFFSL